MTRKGWFILEGQDGDRTLDDQLKGLDPLFAEVEGKRVLDLGCAEGLLLRECMQCGASGGFGLEIVQNAVVVAKKQLAQWPTARASRHDLNDSLPAFKADVVLMLAILHKLTKPLDLVSQVKRLEPNLIVVRLPERTPGFVMDARSNNVRYDVIEALRHEYALERVTQGHFDEWTGFFRRSA